MEEARRKLLVVSRDGGGEESTLGERDDQSEEDELWKRIWVESKKLWVVAGPAVFTRD